jgi:nucleoid DNA-binding protein
MNTGDIIKKVSESHNIPESRAEMIINIIMEKIKDKLKREGEVGLENFGSLKVISKSQVPGSYSETTIFPKKYVLFTPDKTFINVINS